MNLREAILAEHSKANTQKIVQWIGNDPEKIRKLIDILLNDEYRVVQRAAWIMSDVAKIHPDLVQEYVPVLVEKLKDTKAHIAVKRNIYRLLQIVALPEAVHAGLMNDCFESLMNPKEALAVAGICNGYISQVGENIP